MSTAAIETERLSLRPLVAADTAALHALWTAEPVRRFLWDGEAIPLERTRGVVEASAALFLTSGYGIWSVRERGASGLLGFTGYWHFREPPSLELLFGVGAEHWSRGIASEASRGALRFGFEELGFERVAASTDVGNTASVRVLERLGMSFDRREAIDELDTLFYELAREGWEREG